MATADCFSRYATATSATAGNSGRTRGYAPLPKDYDGADEETALHETLHELIAHLPETDRIIVTMHLEGYNYPETGNAVGMTKNNMGVRLMRIKERLKQQWNTI